MGLHEVPGRLLLQGILSVENVLNAHVVLRVSLLVHNFVVQILQRFDLMLALRVNSFSEVVQLQVKS